MKMECLWPGLPSAWHLGDLRGLVASVLFGWAVAMLLAASFIWDEWIASSLVTGLWVSLVIAWGIEAFRSSWTFKETILRRDVGCTKDFLAAQQFYLEGNWFDAEALLLEIVRQKPRDVESLLMLVGVLRHTKRWQAALRRLGQLEFVEAASQWQ